MVDGLNVAPFAPRADRDMSGRGTIIVGDGETYELREFDQDGRLLRTMWALNSSVGQCRGPNARTA